MDEAIAEIANDIKLNQENILKEIINPLVPTKPKGPWDGFWMAVLVKGVQTMVVGIALFLIIFSTSAKDDFWGTIRKLLPEAHSIEKLPNNKNN